MLFACVLLARFFVVGLQVGHKLPRLLREQRLRHAYTARCVWHVDYGAFVVRGDFHSRVYAAGGGAANHQRYFLDAEVFVFLHFARHILHFFKAGRNEAR